MVLQPIRIKPDWPELCMNLYNSCIIYFYVTRYVKDVMKTNVIGFSRLAHARQLKDLTH